MAEQNLTKIDHIVVLMMENRSFDHMLGYLTLDDVVADVDGLSPEMGNPDDPDKPKVFYAVAPIGRRLLAEKVLDPGHGADAVAEQLKGRNSGFVCNYVKTFEKNKQRHEYPPDLVFDSTVVLGFQTASDVPVYDYLARNFCVCDRWFSSVPGPTWPNRLYAATGRSSEPVRPTFRGEVPEFLKKAPIYDGEAFTRHLADDQWRWYSHDPGTLRLIDSRYRPGGAEGGVWDENFAYFNRRTLFERRSFLDDVARDDLPAVSWIDPNFVDFRLYGPPGSNDDHPPSRVMLGQELVLQVVRALMSRPRVWKKTMLVITYDEHGGFFDHVPPGDFPIPGDPERSYGVRVPTLIVSPYVGRGAAHQVFDHTSLLKTILLRFAKDPDRALTAMGERTRDANHLGELLTESATGRARAASTQDLARLEGAIAGWKLQAYQNQLLEEPSRGERLFEAISDLQTDIVGSSLALRHQGLPPGKP